MKNNGNQKSNESGDRSKPGRQKLPKWRFEVPGEKDPKEKIVDGGKWYFCNTEHNKGKGMWTQHHPKDHVDSATWKSKRQNKNGDKSENKAGGGKLTKKTKFELDPSLQAALNCINNTSFGKATDDPDFV